MVVVRALGLVIILVGEEVVVMANDMIIAIVNQMLVV